MSADDRTATVPEGYRPLDVASLAPYLAGQPALRRRLGGAPAAWHVEEVGDGNLNLVFLVRGPAGGLAVKQALPYVRLIGESWPLPLDRAFFEHEALVEHGRHAPGLTPAVYHFDPVLMLTAMELLEPHIIMRRGMIQGIHYPRVAADMAAYMARTLFFTSDLGMGAAEKKARVALFCGNTALCKISEDLIFTEPYMVCDNNRWTAPQLDDIAASFRADPALKRAVSRLKCRFMGSAEALIHGDLHTGSIMVTQDETRVIDPEFAFYGPWDSIPAPSSATCCSTISARTAMRRPPTIAPPTRRGCWRRRSHSGTASRSATARSGRAHGRRLSGGAFRRQ